MTNPESFLEEVAEEVRRDRLFRVFKKYGWLLALIIILILSASIAYEWRKNSKIANSKMNGDLLFSAVSESQSGNLSELLGLFSSNSSYFNPSKDLIAITKLFYVEYAYISQKKLSSDLIATLEEVFYDNKVSRDLRQLAKLKYLLMYPGDEKDKQKLMDELASPDNYYRSLVQEQRIHSLLRSGKYKEASKQIEVLLRNPEVLNSQKIRLGDLQLAIR